ncbi:MAG TPA: transporter substrate-binding domain-containing protein [Stenotrophomonas sp.]|nr:transporter substrate-binding domain-containing protein [Stenotrophomonas sp.]
MCRLTPAIKIVVGLLLVLAWAGGTAALAARGAHSSAADPDLTPARAEATTSFELSSPERKWLNKHPVVTVGSTVAGWPPYEIQSKGQLDGLSYDYLKAMAVRLGIGLRPRIYADWPSLLEAACRGEVDVVMSVSITAQRTRCLAYTHAYQTVHPALVGRQEDAQRLQSAPPSLRVAIEDGHFLSKTLTDVYPTWRVLSVPDLQSALAAVASGRADAYIGDPHALARYLRQDPQPGLALIGPARLPPNTLHFATPNDRGELTAALDHALADVSPQERERMRVHWLEPGMKWANGSPLFSDSERRWVASLPELRITFDPTWAPLTVRGEDGRMTGILGDYLQRMENELGLRVVVVPAQNWIQARALVMAGKADIAPAVSDANYGPQWHLTRTLVTFPSVIVKRYDTDTVADLRDLAGKRILVSDPGLAERLSQRLPEPTHITVTSESDGLSQVMQREADAYIGNLASVDNSLRDHRYDGLQVAAPAGLADRVGLAVREPYADLVPLLNRVVEGMDDDTRQHIRKRWLKVDYEYGIARPVVWWSSAAALIVIALLVAAYLRLRAEIARRREVDTRLREISRNLPAVVFKLRRSRAGEYAFTYVAGNPRPLFGLESAQILDDARALLRRVVEADRPGLLAALKASAEALSPLLYDFHANGADGLRWISLNGVPRQLEDGAIHWSGYWVDSTWLHEQNEALEQARAAAVAAATAKANFLAVMSHEIRTPMAGLSGLLELLDRTPLDPAQRQLLTTSIESAAALRQILDDVLDFSKAEAGEMRLETIELDIRHIVGAALEIFVPQAQKKGLALCMSVAPGLAAVHIGDPFRLRQVLLNLVGNAVKFTHEGHVAVEVHVDEPTPPPADSRQRIRLSVTDTGVGIPASEQEALFRPFVQSDASQTRRYGGTGLGLSICRQLVELMDGQLSLDSEEGRGTRLTVTIDLPVKRPQAQNDPILVNRTARLEVTDPALADKVRNLLDTWGMDTADSSLALPEVWIGDRLDLAAACSDGPLAMHAVVLQPHTTSVPAPLHHVATDPLVPNLLQRTLHELFEQSASRQGRPTELARPPQRRNLPPILVVEDHPTNQLLIGLQLKELGYPYVIADNGEAALAILDELSPSLVLTDISMPKMDGHTLANHIREREAASGRRLPVIAMTANVLDQMHLTTGSGNLDAQIHKPVNLAQLARVLAKWIIEPTPPAMSGNVHELRQRMGEHLQPLLRTFLDSTAEDVKKIEAALARDDVMEVARRVHRVSGALGYFGYTDLAVAGRDLSSALELGALRAHRAECVEFLAMLRAVCVELASLQETGTSEP